MPFLNKYLVLLAICSSVMFSSCQQSSQCGTVTTKATESEVVTLEQWLNTNGITATKDSRGFFYKIVNAGNNIKPNTCNTVRVSYSGSLTDGTEFEFNGNASLNMAQLIKGWQQALPMIGEGGLIKIYLPPSLAYGSTPKPNIPANSILIFDIELKDVL
jgi:FKBP-type peptidyl-prolyl cis-trans isomerase FkpA